MAAVSFDHSWSDGSAINSVLDSFNSGTSLSPNGNVTFNDFSFDQNLSLLDDAFRYTDEICSREMSYMIYRVMIDARKAGPVTKELLLTLLNERSAIYLATPLTEFSMWSKTRLKWIGKRKGFDVHYAGVRFQGRGQLPKRYRLDQYFVNGVGRVTPDDMFGFGYLIARVQARSEHDAARQIFDAQDVLYSLSNVLWREWNIMGGEHHAPAQLWQGPHQFFWNEKKFLGEDRVWFNIDFQHEEWDRHPKDVDQFVYKILPVVKRGLRKLETHPLKKTLTRAMKLISDGMTSRKSSYQLLRYWSAMEALFSDNERNIRYEDITRKSLFAEIDPRSSGLKLKGGYPLGAGTANRCRT